MTEPTLTFFGAAGTVTGSRFLLESPTARILVDAGLYQGPPALRRRNWDAFPVDPASIDEVVLTHAHLDHTGYLPRLSRDGFRGPVRCTAETAELAAIVLRDSAHLQEEDAAFANERGFSRHRPALPLYDSGDVEKTLSLFAPVPLDEQVALAGGVRMVLRQAGHILGSSVVALTIDDRRVLFSGDLGRPLHPLLRPPADPDPADTVVVESTYGDRRHVPQEPGLLATSIRRTVARGGSVLIPAFAVDRTELVLLELRRLMRAGEIPRLRVYVDSPMALAALAVYRRAITGHSSQIGSDVDPAALLEPGDLRAVRTAEESARLNQPAYPCIVISASGMGTGGRVVHHLARQLPDPRNTVVLTGYQAVGTRGRLLQEGARQVKIHGRYVPVRAEIVALTDFSVHADADEVLAWLERIPEPPGTVYVVHGEPRASGTLADRIRGELGWCAVVPQYGERVLLDRPRSLR
jgi:metallo-beta-lactamase family protein